MQDEEPLEDWGGIGAERVFAHDHGTAPTNEMPPSVANDKNASPLITFLEDLDELETVRSTDRIVHILCRQGNLSFLQLSVHYNIGLNDYVIIPNAAIASNFAASPDLDVIVMTLSSDVGNRLALRSSYGIVGHLALLRNPVMKLSPEAAQRAQDDLLRLKARSEETDHFFHEELLAHLLAAHIMDLYDWHAKASNHNTVPDHAADILRQFTNELARGAYRLNRDLSWYANKLFVTPHYLSELCRRASGRGAGYFIDLFTVQEIARRLCDKRESIQVISDDLHFSSVSYFTRYVKRHLGMTPSAFRQSKTK